MINTILERNNHDLLVDATRLLAATEHLQPLDELKNYRNWVLERIVAIQSGSQDILTVLAYGFDEVVPELISRTQQLRREFAIIRDRLVPPLVRSSPEDRLSLRILGWLHSTVSMTSSIPFALSDGGFASWPWPPYAALYFAPGGNNPDLRSRPLFFHEFGHVVYAANNTVFDLEVSHLQAVIDRILTPRSIRNDARGAAEARERAVIVQTWYEWTQEFFCDAVGLALGGPAYLFAFSGYLQFLGAGDFPSPETRTSRDTHPPTSLRIQLLISRANSLGLNTGAQVIENEWRAIASAVGFNEDYYGLYVQEMEEPLISAINRMLISANLPNCRADWAANASDVLITPVQLTNAAWRVFTSDPEHYHHWEAGAAAAFLNNSMKAAYS